LNRYKKRGYENHIKAIGLLFMDLELGFLIWMSL